MTDTSRPPDHDPAGSSFPRWERTTVPPFERQTEAISRMASRSYDIGARDALGEVWAALSEGVSPAQVQATIEHLRRGGTVHAVLEALRDLASQAGEHS